MKCPTKNQILEAAKTGGYAVEQALKTLFPDAFVSKINLAHLYDRSGGHSIFSDAKLKRAGLPHAAIEIRAFGKYADIGFYLNTDHLDWKLERDNYSDLILVPTLK